MQAFPAAVFYVPVLFMVYFKKQFWTGDIYISCEVVLLLGALLHEHDQERDDGHKGNQQPEPLQYGAGVFGPAPRRDVVTLAQLGGPGRNKAGLPAFDPANGHSEFLTDCFHGFALQ